MSLESNNNQLGLNVIKLNEELKEKHLRLNENEKNFEKTVAKLKAEIQEEDLNKTIENDLEVLEKEIEDLKIEQQSEKTNYDDIFNEASSKEIDLNLEMDKLNETKHMLEMKNVEAKAEIRETMQKLEDDMHQAKEENKAKIKNLEDQTNIYQKEMERVRKVNEEKFKQELDNLKEMNNNLRLKISEYQTKKQNLEKELAVRINELGTIREKKEMELKEQKEKMFLEEAEKEMTSAAFTKNQMSNKKPKLNKEELPNLRIPASKYSSTSFSDSSICSLDSTSMLDKKLQKQKRPRQVIIAKLFSYQLYVNICCFFFSNIRLYRSLKTLKR